MATTQNRTFYGGSTAPGSGIYPEDVRILKVYRNYAESEYDPLATSDTSIYIPTVEQVDSSGTSINVTIQKILASGGYPVLVYNNEEYQYTTTGGNPSKYVFMCLSDLSTRKRVEVDVSTGVISASSATVAGGTIYPSLQSAIADASNLAVGDIFETNGFHTSGDGGAARYLVSSTGTANGMDIVQLTTGKLAILQIQDFAYPDQLGYQRNVNTTDVVPYIERIFALGILHVKLHWGRYYMRQTLNMPIASSIKGVARAAYDYPAMSRMLYMVDTGTCAINASNYDVCLENFDLYCSGNVSGKIGILTDSNVDSQRGLAFRNLKVSGFQTSIKLSKIVNWNILFDRVTFEFGEYGLWLETNKLAINLSDCYFNGITEEDVHNKQYSSALSFSHCNFGCRKKVFKNEWNNYDWRNFGSISFYGCHFEVDVYDLADISGCFIDVDNDCQVSLVFVGCDFNADKANPASTTCFKFGSRTRASYIGCHGKESQYVHFDGDFFDPSYPPEPYVGSLKLDAACVGLKEPAYDIDHSMCFVNEGAIYEGYARSNPLNIFDNIVVNYSYAGVRDNGGVLEFFTPTPPQSCASIVVDIPPEYRNTTLTLSCWSGTHNNWYVVGTPVHPDSDRTQTPELLADTYQTSGVRDYCSFNMNGNRYLLFYYYLMAADGNPEKFAMSEGLMIAKGSQYTPYAKHMIVDKRGLHISERFIPPVKIAGRSGALPLASCNDLVPSETGTKVFGEVNTFGGTTNCPTGFSGFGMLESTLCVQGTRCTQMLLASNNKIYTRRADRATTSDPWTWGTWKAISEQPSGLLTFDSVVNTNSSAIQVWGGDSTSGLGTYKSIGNISVPVGHVADITIAGSLQHNLQNNATNTIVFQLSEQDSLDSDAISQPVYVRSNGTLAEIPLSVRFAVRNTSSSTKTYYFGAYNLSSVPTGDIIELANKLNGPQGLRIILISYGVNSNS